MEIVFTQKTGCALYSISVDLIKKAASMLALLFVIKYLPFQHILWSLYLP